MWVLWSKIYIIKTVFENFMKWGLEEKLQMMQIQDLLGMYFDVTVVFVTNSLLLLKFPLAILCLEGLIVTSGRKKKNPTFSFNINF